MTSDDMLMQAVSESGRLLIEADLPTNPTAGALFIHTQRAVNAGISIGLNYAEDVLRAREAIV